MDFRKLERTIKTAPIKPTAYDLALAGGLSARIGADGSAKTLYWRGKKDGRVIRVRLGNYPAMSVEAAAAAALLVRSSVRNGDDPNLAARRKRAGAGSPVTVREAAERFASDHLAVKVGENWRTQAERIMKYDILPVLGTYRLADVRRTDLASLVDKKAAAMRKRGGRGVGANRIVAVLGRFFGFCADKGWLDASPALRLPKPVQEVKRERTLTEREIGTMWLALANPAEAATPMQDVYARVLQLLALTGCRASEITGLQRCHVDLENGTIEIVKGKTISSKRMLPLGPVGRTLLVSAIEAMGEAGAKGDSTAHVFPMPRTGGLLPSNDISKAARRLVADLEHKPWTPHDLRRTLITHLHEAGFDGDVARRIAGHAGVDVHAMVYDRSRQRDKMRDALEQYEKFVLASAEAIKAETKTNVVQLKRSL